MNTATMEPTKGPAGIRQVTPGPGPSLPILEHPAGWFLSPVERGNPDTVLDSRHRGSRAWSVGNEVRPLVDGAVYFRDLLAAVVAMGPGDLLLFTDW